MIFIVLLAILLRLIFFSGMGISDSLAYSKTANNINLGKYNESPPYFQLRLGLNYIIALSYKIFGINDFSSVLFVLLTSIGNIVLIYHFGKLLFSKKIGLMAAFLLSFFPLDVVYATKLLSDMPAAFFMALGVYLFLYSEIKSKNLYLFSGIFIGIGYLIRESVLLIALFFVLYALYNKRIKKEYLLVMLGFLVVFAIETLIFFNLTEDPLFRVYGSQAHMAQVRNYLNYFGRLDFPTGLFHYPWLILTNNLLHTFYIAIFIAIAYCLVYRRKETSEMLIWFIPLLLYLSFGSASILEYSPFKAADRYLSIITIPGILLLAFFLMQKKDLIKIIRPIILIILVTTSITFVSLREDRNLLGNIEVLYPYLETLEKPIYVDGRSIETLDYISDYKLQLNINKYPVGLATIKDSYIIVNRMMIRNLKEADKNRIFSKEIDNPPEKWIKIKEIGEEEKDKIVIYYIP